MVYNKLKKDKLPVLLLAGSECLELAIAKGLAQYDIPTYLLTRGYKKPLSSYSNDITSTFYNPDPLIDEKGFILSLTNIGQELLERYKRRILLFTMEDTGLLLLARNYDLFKKYFVILGDPDENNILRYSQKIYIFNKLQNLEFIPLTFPCTKKEDIERIKMEITFPCIVKPSEKDISYSFYHTYKSKILVITNKHILEEKLLELLSKGYKLVVQEMVNQSFGKEICWWGYRSKNGDVFGMTTHEIRKYPSIGGTATFEIAEDIPEIYDYANQILKQINFWGMCEIPFMQDKMRKYKVLEINPRCWLQILLAIKMGLNLPYIAYKEVYEGRVIKPTINWEKPKKWVRIEDDFMAGVIKGQGDKTILQRLIKWIPQVFFNNTVHPIYSLSDFKVIIMWLIQLPMKIYRNLFR